MPEKFRAGTVYAGCLGWQYLGNTHFEAFVIVKKLLAMSSTIPSILTSRAMEVCVMAWRHGERHGGLLLSSGIFALAFCSLLHLWISQPLFPAENTEELPLCSLNLALSWTPWDCFSFFILH